MKKYDVCIAGGGASGCMAAVNIARENSDCNICIIEKNRKLLRKVAASGNGRCNILNRNFIHSDEIEAFFFSMGVCFAEEEEGRLYPYSKSSESVIEAFMKELEKRKIDIYCETKISEIRSGDDGFTVTTDKGKIMSDKLLIATGGKSAPEFGTTGDGFTFAKNLGHSVNRLRPSLTAIECEGDFEKLKGCRAESEVTLLKDGKPVAEEYGEVQFTEDGLSGICIFNLSKYLIIDEGRNFSDEMKRYDISIDFVPDMEENALRIALDNGGMISFLKKPLRETVKPEELKNWKVKVKGAKGWKKSQVTAGGVSLDEIDDKTMESKLVRNLYFAGEVTDYDGICGGYNLGNAWITGIRAGKAMAGDV